MFIEKTELFLEFSYLYLSSSMGRHHLLVTCTLSSKSPCWSMPCWVIDEDEVCLSYCRFACHALFCDNLICIHIFQLCNSSFNLQAYHFRLEQGSLARRRAPARPPEVTSGPPKFSGWIRTKIVGPHKNCRTAQNCAGRTKLSDRTRRSCSTRFTRMPRRRLGN